MDLLTKQDFELQFLRDIYSRTALNFECPERSKGLEESSLPKIAPSCFAIGSWFVFPGHVLFTCVSLARVRERKLAGDHLYEDNLLIEEGWFERSFSEM